MSLSYRQKLLDPRWQRKRLGKLDEAGWACEACGATEDTLHVHHPRYVKGREPWEYPTDELEVLCAACHKAHHDREAALGEIFQATAPLADTLAAVVAGYLCSAGLGRHGDALGGGSMDFATGIFAYLIEHAPTDVKLDAARVLILGNERPPGLSVEEWEGYRRLAGA